MAKQPLVPSVGWFRGRRGHLFAFEPIEQTPDRGVIVNLTDLTLCQEFPSSVFTAQLLPVLVAQLRRFAASPVAACSLSADSASGIRAVSWPSRRSTEKPWTASLSGSPTARTAASFGRSAPSRSRRAEPKTTVSAAGPYSPAAGTVHHGFLSCICEHTDAVEHSCVELRRH